MQITIERMQAIGLAGVAILFFGCFSPLFHLPIVGSVSFIGNGEGDGIFVVALALVAAVLLFVKAYPWVLAPAGGATLICVATFFKFVSGMSSMRAQLAGEMKDNPFAGLASAFVQNISLEWGWALLIIGLLCLFVAASTGFFPARAHSFTASQQPIRDVPPLQQSPRVQPQQHEQFISPGTTKRSSFGQKR